MRQLVFFIVLAIAVGVKCTKETVLESKTAYAAYASNAVTVPEGKIMVVKCDTTFIDDTTIVPPPPPPDTVISEPPPPPQKNIVFFGSSTIALWNVEQAFPGMPVKKAGFGGKTWANLYTLADTIAALNPKQVIIYSGDNDMIARRTVAQMTTDIQKLINRIWTLVPDVPVVFLYTKPSDTAFKVILSDKVTTGIQGIEYTNRNVSNWGKTNHPTKFVALDSYAPFLLWNPKRLNVNHYVADKLHLNQATGYPILNKLVAPVLKQ